MAIESLNLAEVKRRLDDLAVELLKARFPHVNVESYYMLAEAFVDELMRRDKKYKRDVQSENPVKTLITLAMDKLVFTYDSISGKKNKKNVNRLLDDFEAMISRYLESIGVLVNK